MVLVFFLPRARAGGFIVRDENGEPTGIFVDDATAIMTTVIPPLSYEEELEALQRTVEECHRFYFLFFIFGGSCA